MEARSFPYDRGKTGWAAAAAAVRFATRQEEAETVSFTNISPESASPPTIGARQAGLSQ